MMLDLFRGIGEFLAQVLRVLFGERLDTGFGIAAAAYVSIVALSFAIGAVRSIWELTKAVDLRFDKDKLDHHNISRPNGTPPRTIDWVLAREQQVRSLWFTIPFGILAMATLYYWVRESFTLKGYVLVGLCWIIGYMLVRPWWIWTVLRVKRKLVKTGEAAARHTPLYNKTLVWAMRHYFSWGLQQTTQKRRAFIGLLRWANPFVDMFRFKWLRVRLIRPLLVCAFYGALWLVTLPIAVFYLNREFDAREPELKPAWAKRYAPEPTYETGAIPDSPGDAAATA